MAGSNSVLKVLRDTVAFNLKAIEREIADFEAITTPTSLDELRARALVMFYAGFYPQARPLINALVALEPIERNIVKLAQVEQRLGNAAHAVTIAQRAISSYPNSFAAYEVLANSLLETGEYDSALQAAKHALVLEPASERMKAAFALAEYATNKTGTSAGPKLLQTGDSQMNAILSGFFVGGAILDSDFATIASRSFEDGSASIMARVEMIS